jgi:D-alanyl-D-alanine carboxypeptidase/D-alanyl-D-alanine-endopeptidase (penicillin-binding protein 4)
MAARATTTSVVSSSPKRSTTTTSTTAAPLPLAAQLDATLVNTNACLVVRAAGGLVLYDHEGAMALAPASTEKLLVAAAALAVLGPSYRFTTTVVAARPPLFGHVGDLWLVGGGDPVLSSPEFTFFLGATPLVAGQPVTTPLGTLADQLVAAGVRVVSGGIHGDDSRYDRTRFLAAWSESEIKGDNVAPIGALEVDDGLDQWKPPRLTVDPAAHAAGVLARLAAARGIAVGQGADGTAPVGAVTLATVMSPPLADIVTSMLRNSDNTAAEMLVRELDRATGGAGTTAGGLTVVTREAAALGLPTAGLHLDDGSGLAASDRASCDTLLAALDLSTQPQFAALGMLSVAGRFGTLVDRFLGTPAVGHVEAKTGSIDGVAGLVGRMDEHVPLEFAFLLNGKFGYAGGVAYENRIVAALGTVTTP